MFTKPVSSLSFDDFTYKSYISDLTDAEFVEARDTVLAMWSGVLELWGALPEELRNRKRSALLNLLCMWYLADMYPTRLVGGQQSSGGMLLGGKSIRDVHLQYNSLGLPDDYNALATNQWGIKAAFMIRYAPDMMGIYGSDYNATAEAAYPYYW